MTSAKFATVRLGLNFIFWGVISFTVTIVAQRVLKAFIDDEPIVDFVINVLQMIASGIVLAGQILCSRVPSDMKGKGLVWAALICQFITFASILSLFFWDPIKVLVTVRAVLAVAFSIVVMFIAADIFFNVFLKSLAIYVNDKQSASRASGLLILKLIVLGLLLFSIFWTLAAVGKGDAKAALAGPMVFIIAGLLSLLVLYQYLTLLIALRYTLLGSDRPRFKRSTAVDDEETLEDMFKGFEG